MASNAIEAGKAFLRLFTDDAEFKKGLDGSLKELDKWAKKALKIGAQIGAVGTAISAPFVASVKIFTDMGSELNDMSERTGIAVEALSELKYAAEQSGTSLETIVKAAKHMQSEGVDPRRFGEIAAEIAKIQDPVKRAQAAMEAFGSRSGQQLLPVIKDLGALSAEARKSGIVMDTATAKAADKLGDAFGLLKAQVLAVAVHVGAALGPSLQRLADHFSKILPGVIAFVKENRSLVVAVAVAGGVITAFGAVCVSAAGLVYVLTASIYTLKAALTSLAKHPYAIAVTIVLTILTAMLANYIDKWMEAKSAQEEAAGAATEAANAQKLMEDAIRNATGAVDGQSEAMKKLNDQQRALIGLSDKRTAAAKKDKEILDLMKQAELEKMDTEIDRLRQQIAQPEISTKLKGILEKQLEEVRRAREKLAEEPEKPETFAEKDKRIAKEERERLEREGERIKDEFERQMDKWDAQAKKDEDRKKEIEKMAEEAHEEGMRELERIEDEKDRANEKRARDAESLAENIAKQVGQADKVFQGASGGQFYRTQAGVGKRETTEKRLIKVEEDQKILLGNIRDLLKNKGVVLIGKP